MINFIITIFLVLVFTIVGSFAESHNLITSPAGWAFFGGVFGVILTIIVWRE